MPHDEVTNEDRAAWAGRALDAFMSEAFAPGAGAADAVMDEALVDLLCDLCHLAKSRGMDPVEAVRKGLAGFLMEDRDENDARVEIVVDGPAAPAP